MNYHDYVAAYHNRVVALFSTATSSWRKAIPFLSKEAMQAIERRFKSSLAILRMCKEVVENERVSLRKLQDVEAQLDQCLAALEEIITLLHTADPASAEEESESFLILYIDLDDPDLQRRRASLDLGGFVPLSNN